MKKSLIGLPFNRNENSTEGIEVDPSIFQVHADQVKNWQPIDKSERGLLGCSKDVAQMVVEKLCFEEEEEDAEIHDSDQLKNENYRSGTKADDADGKKRDDSFLNQVCFQLSLGFLIEEIPCRLASRNLVENSTYIRLFSCDSLSGAFQSQWANHLQLT